MRKIFGFALALLGGLSTLFIAMWPITGNHGVTWPQALPALAISGGALVLGVFLVMDPDPNQEALGDGKHDKDS